MAERKCGTVYSLSLPVQFLYEDKRNLVSHYAAADSAEQLLAFLQNYGINPQFVPSDDMFINIDKGKHPRRLARYFVEEDMICSERANGVRLCVATPSEMTKEEVLALVYLWKLKS